MSYNNSGFSFDLILPSVKLTAKKQVLQLIAEKTSKIIGIREKLLYTRLTKMQQTQNPNTDDGTLLLDLKASALTQSFMVLTILDNPISFNETHTHPVDLVCTLISPEHEEIQHLQELARWSRLLHDSKFCNMLRAANDEDDIRIIMESVNHRMRAA